MNKNKTEALRELILDCADFEGYPDLIVNPTSDHGKIQALSDIFESEKGWEIKRHGGYRAATSWFQGLASACTVPFSYDEIRDFYGKNELDMTFDGNVEMSEDYFTSLGEVFCDMIAGRV